MGNRSNIYFRNGDNGIGVYSHWSGTDMAAAAMRVLDNSAFQSRLGDPSYATRIAVQAVLEHLGSDTASDTGFGLWTSETGECDNEHRFIVIDVNDGSLYITDDWRKVKDAVRNPTVKTIRDLM